MYYSYYEVDKFTLYIEANDDAITCIKVVDSIGDENTCSVIESLKKELDLYFDGKLTEFTINYKINYLEWRQKLYKHIQDIKYGEQLKIKELLPLMNLDSGVRAVAKAMNNNPLIIVIPCHRVNSVIRKLKAHSYSNEFQTFLQEHESKQKNNR